MYVVTVVCEKCNAGWNVHCELDKYGQAMTGPCPKCKSGLAIRGMYREIDLKQSADADADADAAP